MNLHILPGDWISELHGGAYRAIEPGDGGRVFPVWCAEKSQSLRFGDTIEYQVIDGVDAWGNDLSTELDRLLSWTSAHDWPTSAGENDAIQTAIWAILSGQTGQIAADEELITQHAMLLSNPDRQDLLMTQTVDEPDPLALMLLGIAAIAVWRLA